MSGNGAGGSTTCSSAADSLAVRNELAGSLPIGVARMVELARAIVDEPKLLLLDEPASGLDETEIVRLGEQIQAVRDETGCTILLVEHNAGFVMQQSDRVVVLNLGTLLAQGLPRKCRATRPCATPTSARPRCTGRLRSTTHRRTAAR